MKVVKTILKYMMFGLLIFFVTGMIASSIKNSDSSQTSQKIFK